MKNEKKNEKNEKLTTKEIYDSTQKSTLTMSGGITWSYDSGQFTYI